MLEAVLSKMITHYLKEYLKPLEPGQMELKILQGSLKLFNLQLLPTALIGHLFPFIIRKGSVKYAKIIFPWNNLKNAACDILIEDVFVVLQFDSEIILKSDFQADQKSFHIKSETNQPTSEEQMKIIQGLFESIIDNLHVLIKNIHVRIEFPGTPKPIIIGIYTPEISFQTIDEKGQFVTTIQHPHFVRKQLLIQNFSIYFDTNQDLIEIKDDKQFSSVDAAIQEFTENMIKIMKQDHQYWFKPMEFKSILIHTKDKTEKITNQIETTIKEVSLSLDLQQSRSIIHLNYLWNQFMKKRKYINCSHPKSFNKPIETWLFAHQCAIVKNKTNVFKPFLALTILRNRLKYIDLFKQAKASKLSPALLGSPKQKLEALEKKIGKTASIYLRELSEAIYLKEQALKDHSNVTAFDISELKSIFESTELVFSMHQFKASFQIITLSLELLYEKNDPLISLNCQQIAGYINSLEDAVDMNIHADDLSVISYVNEQSHNLFQRIPYLDEESNKTSFIALSSSIPMKNVVSSFNCEIAPIKLTLDSETLESILSFFSIPDIEKIESDKNYKWEIGELLQCIKRFRNYKISVKMSQIAYDFPFMSDDDKLQFLKLEMRELNITQDLNSKPTETLMQIPMQFNVSMNLSAKIDEFDLFTSEKITSKIDLTFTTGKLGININPDIDLATLNVFVSKNTSKALFFAINNFREFSQAPHDVIMNSRGSVIIVGRSKINIGLKLNALNIFLDDENKDNEMKFLIGNFNASAQMFLSTFHYSFLLNELNISQFNLTFVEILDKIEVNLDKNAYDSPMIVDISVGKPHIFLNFASIQWIMAFSDLIKSYLNKGTQIHLNEPIMQTDENNQIKKTSKQSSFGRFSRQSSGFLQASESRLKLTKEYTPSNMTLTNSILKQSIDDFLEKAGAYDEFSPLFRSASNSMSNDVIDDDYEYEEEEEEIDEYMKNDILVPKDLEIEEGSNTNIKLNVTNVWIEMLDRGENPVNSYFKAKSISLLDFSPEGFKLAFKEFTISRENRIVFKPSDFIVPIYMPEPIDIFLENAEADLFSGDIMALSYDSPTIFKLMFGGITPLIQDHCNVNIYSKIGTAYFMERDRSIISTTNVTNVSVCISIAARVLNVDVKLDSCNGIFEEDKYHFVDMEGTFHCHYIGTNNSQDILVEIPSAKLSLKHSFLQWGAGFVPTEPVEQVLQPLKIKLFVEPSQINFLAKETCNNSKNYSLLETSSSNLFNDLYNDDYSRIISIILGKSNCSAIRDNGLDLDLEIDGIHIQSDIFDHPIFGISHIHFVKNQRLVKSKVPSFEVNLPISLLAHLANEISSFIPKDFVPAPPFSTPPSLPDFGVDLEMENFAISFYPTPKRALRLEMPGVKFILNPSHKISGFEIKSIKIFTVYHSDNPILVVNLSNIQSIITFAEKTDFDLEKTTLNSISKLPQVKTTKGELQCLYFMYKMELIQINYTHFFAKTLIFSIFKSMIDCESLPRISSISVSNLEKLKLHINCSIDEIQINFVIIDPFASVSMIGINLSYNEKLKASVKDMKILPLSKEKSMTTTQRSLFIKKNLEEDSVSITIENGELYAILSECSFYIDLKLLFSLTRFMMASPFLKIKPLLAEIKKSKDPNATIQKMDYITFSKTLPFSMIFNLKKTHISVPLSLDDNNSQELEIHISALVDANSSSLSLNMISLSLNFYDSVAKTIFPPILSDFTTHLFVEIEEDFSLSFKANILDINLIFSAGDIYSFVLLGRSIEKALNSQIFAFEDSTFDIFKLRISSIELISANTTLVLCKDTRSSSQVVPIFKFVIPPIMFKVKKTTDKNIKTPVEFDFQPYIEYFNVLTGNYDLIVEPASLHLYSYIIDDQMKFGINILSCLNINFPLSAILKIKGLINEITESLETDKPINYSDLPSMWLSNKLGSSVFFKIGDENLNVEHNMLVPLYHADLATPISFSIDGKKFHIECNSFNYPTYLSKTILAVKNPYKGGMMINFERTYQIENNLSFPLDMYIYNKTKKEYVKIFTIESHKREPLVYDEETSILFHKKDGSDKIKQIPLKLYLLDKSLSVFQINYDNNKSVHCIKTVYNDTNIAARIVSISSQYILMNLLPSTLFFKYENNNEITSVERGETTDVHFIENGSINAFLSLDENNFLPKISNCKVDYKNTTSIDIFNPETKTEEKCLVEFEYDKEIGQTTIIFYMPVVVFNKSLLILDIEVFKSNIELPKDSCNYSNSLEVLSNMKRYWCPYSLINHSSDDSLTITVRAKEISKDPSKPFDCLTTGNTSLLLKSYKDDDLFIPLRCNLSNQSRTSVITISSLITLKNDLDFDIVLTPIRNIPKEIPQKDISSFIEGDKSICEKFGPPIRFNANSEIIVSYIPLNGTFAISIDGFSTSPSISLLEPQKTVFKVQNKTDFILIELQVTDIETEILAEFKKVSFPTPILINNQLDIPISAFQLVYLTPFQIMPHSTSIFAFDEPFVYPSVTVSFKDDTFYRISLVEDTEKIEMRKRYNNCPVYVQVKHTKYGNRLVIITQEEDEPPEKYKFIFESSIYGIAASLIDLQMRETALIYLSHLDTKLTFNVEYIAVSISLKSFQIDDQNPLAPHPTVLYGHFTEENPYLSFNCLCPIRTSTFTSFDYFAINSQRIDIDADCSFISDWLNLFTSLDIKSIHSIQPMMPSQSNQNNLIALHYFEVTPALLNIKYNRKTSRPPMLGKVPRFMKFIPSKEGKMLLPGVVISRLTDRINSIETKLIDDYKTAAFNSILKMLGRAGKILKILGIASAIASSFNIKMTSDTTNEIPLNSLVKNTSSHEFLNNQLNSSKPDTMNMDVFEYDNRFDDDDLSSCFSYEALSSLMKKINENSMEPSPLIRFTIPKFSFIKENSIKVLNSNSQRDIIKKKLLHLQEIENEAIQQAGLHMKLMPGIGYGRGIGGVLTKELNDPLDGVQSISYNIRIRETRPYAGAKISVFNPSIAYAQKIIFKNGGMNEKAREISVSKENDKKVFIIMTENTLYVFNEDLNVIINSVKFNEVCDIAYDNEQKLVSLKLKNGKIFKVIIDSKISLNFLLSILRMNHRFNESLLL